MQSHESEHANSDSRYVWLMGTGLGATVIGSLVWSAGIVTDSSSWIDELTIPGACVTTIGTGAMAVGSVLHHRHVSDD